MDDPVQTICQWDYEEQSGDNVSENIKLAVLQKYLCDGEKHTKWHGTPRFSRVSLALEHVLRLTQRIFMATCTAKSFGDAIENHKKYSHMVEIQCQDAKAENNFAGSVIENRYVSFPVLNQIKPQAPLLVAPLRHFSQVPACDHTPPRTQKL